MTKKWAPVLEGSRLESLDIVRGFAIFGIFIVNIGAFSAPYFMYGGAESVWTAPMDRVTLSFIDIFFQGSFYPLFSILFGFSWQMMYERTVSKDIAPYRFLLRRQLLLIIFGALHAFFIWHGDILFTYGFVGILLLMFLHLNSRKILMWASILLLGSTTLLTLGLYNVRSFLGGYNEEMIAQSIANYSSGELTVIWNQNLQDWIYNNGGMTFLLLIVMILPLFLIGVFIARQGWIHEPEKHRKILRRLLFISFIIFIVCKAGPYLIGNPLWMSYLQDQIGGTASALFYFIALTFISQTLWGRKIFDSLRYVGRMSLSNYLLQSIFCFVIFYVLGFYHWVGPLQSIFIVIGFFVIQVYWSKWWLARFRFGPFEWLLRSLNYQKFQQIRKD